MSGTLISDLDNVNRSDTDLVQSILTDLDQGSQPQQQRGMTAPPPPMGPRMPMQPVQPIPNNFPTAVDPAVPTAHMIGREHPTQADFQQMMMTQQGNLPYNPMVPQMYPAMMQQPFQEPVKNSTGQWIDELKEPIIITIIFFVLSLEYLNMAASKYMPTLLTPGGSFTTTGLLIRAALGGGLYLLFQKVVAPLINF